MTVSPQTTYTYHVFIASPGDIGEEREHVRQFFKRYNRHHARIWNVRFEVIDWENYSTTGVGRPQELITQQTLEKYRDSLALVVGIMAQRFGMQTGEAESGTEEEFNWALESYLTSGWPEIKWFFRRVDEFVAPGDPGEIEKALKQWKKVRAFRRRLQTSDPPVYYAEYPGPSGFRQVLENDLNMWLSDADRPWVPDFAAPAVEPAVETTPTTDETVPGGFDVTRYRRALMDRFNVLNFEMLDVSGAYYGGVRLWNVFVPQSVRECHEYTPRILEMPKEHVERLVETGELSDGELAEARRAEDDRRRQYLSQPIRPVLDIIDDSSIKRCAILGDPGSGKSALLRFLALRWGHVSDHKKWDALPVPLLVELRNYHRWDCRTDKSIVKYLHRGSSWHRLNQQTLNHLTDNPERVVLLLDGLDEIFDPAERERVIGDIQRFCSEFPDLRIVITSRVVGYRSQRLREEKFRHFMIQDLDENQIDAFAGFWHDVTFDNADEGREKRKRLLKAINQSKSIAQLAGNPLLLTMMAILNRHQELPRDRADLYHQCARLLLHQWDVERKLLAEFPGMSAEIGLREKTEILRLIAARMQESPGGLQGNIIDGTALTGLIEDYVHERLRFEQPRAVARALVRQLRERNFILCYLGADTYAFVHRTFLEYFCAAEIVHRFNVAKTLDIDGLVALFDEHCREDDWHEVLRLVCGQIDEQFVARIIEHLTMRADLDNWDFRTQLPELPLAIGCLSEVRGGGQLEEPGTKLLKTCIRCFSKGRGVWAESFVLDLVAAAEEVGVRWPGKSAFQFTGQHPISGPSFFQLYWPRFLAAVFVRRSWIERLADCEERVVRWGAIETLAENWPDQDTRELLRKQAINDDHYEARRAALQSLAKIWPDHNTRDLLQRRAVNDDHGYVRGAALRALAENWPDQNTRDLLQGRAVNDTHREPRSRALRALAEQWGDQDARELIQQRAVNDDDVYTRAAALRALAETWPDQKTRELLQRRAVQDPEEEARGAAFDALGAMHSEFGRILPTGDLDEIGPHLDPLEPVPREHIERAAERAGIPPGDIDEAVASLSDHLGWDITRGASESRGTDIE